jgi:hypothetical protein
MDDPTHFLRCHSPAPAQWRISFLCNLRAHMETSKTNFELMTVILDAITVWLQDDSITPEDYPRRCRRAIIAQTAIRWHESLQGYWAHEWSILQDAHLRNTSKRIHTSTGQTWATRTITRIWDYVQAAWKIHNDNIHAQDAKTEDTDLKIRTHFRIIRLHQQQNETLAMHRDYFFDNPTATLDATSLNFQRNWLNLYEPAILESIKMAESESIRATPALTQYFVTTRPGPIPQPKFDKRHHKTKRRCKHAAPTKHIFSNHRIPRYFSSNPSSIIITQHSAHRTRRSPSESCTTNPPIHNPYFPSAQLPFSTHEHPPNENIATAASPSIQNPYLRAVQTPFNTHEQSAHADCAVQPR